MKKYIESSGDYINWVSEDMMIHQNSEISFCFGITFSYNYDIKKWEIKHIADFIKNLNFPLVVCYQIEYDHLGDCMVFIEYVSLNDFRKS